MAVLQDRFLDNVRARLSKLEISQSELARRMGVSQPMVAQYLAGRRSPGFEMVEKFAAGLEMDDPLELLGEVVHSN